MATNKKNNIIYIALFIESFSFWSFIPILPYIIETCLICKEDIDYTAKMASFILLIYGLISFISAHFISRLCFKFGFKKIFIGCLSCVFLNNLILTFNLHINWVILSRFFAGLGSSVFLIANLYVNNLHDDKNKQTKMLGNFTAANFLGMIIASFMSGIITHYHSVSLVYYINSFLSFITLSSTFFFLPNLVIAEEVSFKTKTSSITLFKNIFKDLKKYFFKNKMIAFLASLITLTFIVNESIQISWAFYSSEKLQWNENLIGLSMSFLGIITILTQLFLIKPFIGFHKVKFSILIGVILLCLANLFLTLFDNNILIWSSILLIGLGSISTPFIRTFYNHMFNGQNLNNAIVFISRVESFVEFIIPFIVLNIFAIFSKKNSSIYFPSIIFFILFVLYIFILSWFLNLSKNNAFENKTTQ